MPKLNHPWRQAHARGSLGLVGVRRSDRFTYYLQTLPSEERTRIEAAERKYVEETRDATGRHASAERDFDESMQGIKENDPGEYRGFVA
jgi:hypothetical protein